LKVIKFGGSSLKDAKGFRDVAAIIENEKEKKIVILSGVCGVTDVIQTHVMYKKLDEIAIQGLIHQLKRLHFKISSEAISDTDILKEVHNTLQNKIEKLEQLLRGVYYIEELTERTKDLILSYGERLSVPILAGILNNRGIKADDFEADNIGILTNGDFGNAVAELNSISENLKNNVLPLLDKNIVPIITGFFGCNTKRDTTLFGRNGSDYSASVVAYAVDADVVEIWKDVDGFLSADPTIIKDARLIKHLSYREAAELSYFGAKILHPRTVDPLMQKNIPIHIKNVYNPDNNGTKISKNRYVREELVKSVSYSNDIAVIKIHGSGVGKKPGVLSEIVTYISSQKINIKSVITSQTCINLLIDKKDLNQCYNLLNAGKIKTVEKIEKIKDVALICVVGEGLLSRHGIAARVFSVVADNGINVEMISAGASEVAYYFIVKERFLNPAITAIHKEFFG